MESCTPAKPKRFICGQAMNEAISAYHQLMTGQQKVMVRHGETEVRYEAKNIKALREYILGLYQMCPSREAAAMLGIPVGRRPGVPVFSNTRWEDPNCGCNPAPAPCEDCQ